MSLEQKQLQVAYDEADRGRIQGGVPIGAAVFGRDGELLGRGHNRRIQDENLFMHAETAAMTDVGAVAGGFSTVTLVSTLAPCWFCSGLIRQFNVGRVLVGDSVHDLGGIDWLRELGVDVVDLNDPACIEMLENYRKSHPDMLLAGQGKTLDSS